MSEQSNHPQDQSYQSKATEMAREYLKKQQRKIFKERNPFLGLQIIPKATYYDESKGHTPGESNWKKWGFDIHPQVSLIAGGLVILFIVMTLVFKEQAGAFFTNMLNSIGDTFGWFYMLAANFFVIVMIIFAASKYGSIKLGGPDALPEFSTFSWYAMLISAGMGIGLMFWSVAEPIFHYASPSPMFDVPGYSPQSAQSALGVTYFHWGLHPWGIYTLVGLSLAFFAYNRGLPLTIRSVFYPVLKDKIYGFWGNLIDILSVLATLFGLATSLGLGVQQVAAGLNYLFGFPTSTEYAVLLIGIITLFATLSVVAGLDKGVRLLSSANLYLAGIFMLFIIIVGPTIYILKAFTQNLGFYLQKLPELSFWVETYHGAEGSNWQNLWTIFYWGWWISWSPFVGMFIARVSKGRTVREFIMGVMILPTLLSFLWMSTMGGSAINLQTTGAADIVSAVQDNVSTALFVMLKNFPLTQITSFTGVLLVIIFFVTSSDSGSLVVDHLTSGGKLDSPVPQRIFWAVMEGVCAAVLLLGGGLTALQSASIAAGLPFTFILIFMVYSLYRGLEQEYYHATIIKKINPDVQNFEVPLQEAVEENKSEQQEKEAKE
ncbi:BCCT family transporter [Saccharicrinis sp. FJH54]|uniref:BCCT family transporter n=1 Tax=Saccharicrinis sp. FJH54 TaxID=3344665 RepID=UPI0035D41B7B